MFSKEFIIKFKFVVPKDWQVEGLVNLIKSDKSVIITSLSHELMHAYDSHKSGYDDASERANYQASQSVSFGIDPIDKFLHLLYFTHAAENVVRPTEIAMSIKLGKVSQTLGEKVYAAMAAKAGAEGGNNPQGATAKDDNVVDAEFKEVNKK